MHSCLFYFDYFKEKALRQLDMSDHNNVAWKWNAHGANRTADVRCRNNETPLRNSSLSKNVASLVNSLLKEFIKYYADVD